MGWMTCMGGHRVYKKSAIICIILTANYSIIFCAHCLPYLAITTYIPAPAPSDRSTIRGPVCQSACHAEHLSYCSAHSKIVLNHRILSRTHIWQVPEVGSNGTVTNHVNAYLVGRWTGFVVNSILACVIPRCDSTYSYPRKRNSSTTFTITEARHDSRYIRVYVHKKNEEI